MANQGINLKRINLIIYVIRHGRFTMDDHEILQKYTDVFKHPCSISALVINNCDFLSDVARTTVVEDFKSGHYTKDYAAIMGKGIYTVGFPNLHCFDDNPPLKEVVKLRIQEDVIKLHQLIEESNDVLDVHKSIDLESNDLGRCSIM